MRALLLQRFDRLHYLHLRLLQHGPCLRPGSGIHHVRYLQRLASIVTIFDAAPSGLTLTVATAAAMMTMAIFVFSSAPSAVVASRSAFTVTSCQTSATSLYISRSEVNYCTGERPARYYEIYHSRRSWRTGDGRSWRWVCRSAATCGQPRDRQNVRWPDRTRRTEVAETLWRFLISISSHNH
jgi:hypothetical protein